MTNVNFTIPVTYKSITPNRSTSNLLAELAEGYLSFGGKVANVVHIDPNTNERRVEIVTTKRDSVWIIALKIASYATLILPTIAFVIKGIHRATHSFTIQPSNPSKNEHILTICEGYKISEINNQEKGIILETIPGMPDNTRGKVGFLVVDENSEKRLVPVCMQPKPGIFAPRPESLSWLSSDDIQLIRPGGQNPLKAIILEWVKENKTMSYETEAGLRLYGLKTGPTFLFQILSDPYNKDFNLKHFLAFLKTDEGKDFLHKIRSPELIEDVLDYHRESGHLIDLYHKPSEDEKNLMTRWAALPLIKDELLRELIQLDPGAFKNSYETDGFLEVLKKLATSGTNERNRALFFFQMMKKYNIQTSKDDKLLYKIISGETSFTKSDMSGHSIEVVETAIKAANVSFNYDFLKFAKSQGYSTSRVAPFEEASITHVGMDALEVKQVYDVFFKDLRTKGLLLTNEEFNLLDRTKYYPKARQIGRILGRDYVEKVAKEKNCPFVCAPVKTAVIDFYPEVPFDKRNAFDISFGGRFVDQEPKSKNLMIYAEKIKPLTRKASRQEMQQLLTVLEACGYSDFLGENIVLGENPEGKEAFYIIDTEFENFRDVMNLNCISGFITFMDESDHEWFSDKVKQLYERNKQKEEQRAQSKKDAEQTEVDRLLHKALDLNGFMIKRKLIFDISELTKIKPVILENAAATV